MRALTPRRAPRAAGRARTAQIPPYDDAHVIAGQGTLAIEMHRQLAELQPDRPPLDAIFVPISGGGMAAGVAIATRSLSPATRVIAVEPAGKGLGASLEAGRPLWPENLPPLSTLADGCRTAALGRITWPICHELLDRTVVPVTDAQITEAMRLTFDLAKLVVEPSGAMSLAAALAAADALGVRRVGLVLCGGNVDFDQPLPFVRAASG